ncbi:MAG TPA: arylsulfatase [Planctomycetota bacterium]|nr:arylsulfatase [Planctomycetota bacterium]
MTQLRAPEISKRLFMPLACRLMCCLIGLFGCAGLAAESRPNVVVILVDDMGWADLGCYGSEIPTPNIDALAANGLRFTQFYNTGRCCPSRASLLTGLYSHQAGVGNMTQDYGEASPGYRGRLNTSCVTIAEVLRSAGYFTAMSGKWHVGQEHGVKPSNRGFDRSFNSIAGGFYFSGDPKAKLFLNGERIANDDQRLPRDWYLTDLWTRMGLQFIEEGVAAKKPFFLYLAYNAPHFPLQAPAEEIARFRGMYKKGWDAVSAQRHARQIELGLIERSWKKARRTDDIAEWDSLSNEARDRLDHIMAVYAATVSHMDKAIGDVVKTLKEKGQFDNTLIFFMSDNGGTSEGGVNGKNTGDPSTFKSDWFAGESWAWVQNTPFRRYKRYNHEGGIATPLVAHWPAGIVATNEVRSQPSHLIDIMATVVDVTGAAYPTTFNEKSILPMEGKSLRPVFSNKPLERDALYWEHEGNAAVRAGDWKLVRLGNEGKWELYDLKADRTEQNNLAAQMPEKVAELQSKWRAWAERCHVIDKPSGKKKKSKD